MRFVANTVFRPVVGAEAERLTADLEKGGHVANRTALETIGRIVRARRDLANALNNGWG